MLDVLLGVLGVLVLIIAGEVPAVPEIVAVLWRAVTDATGVLLPGLGVGEIQW